MALLGNTSSFSLWGSIGYNISASYYSRYYNAFNKSGQQRNAWAGGTTGFNAKSSYPAGARNPEAYRMPQKAGGLASKNNIKPAATTSGLGVNGLPTSGIINCVLTTSATGGLIAGAVGSITCSATVSAQINSPANIIGNTSASATTSGLLGAIAGLSSSVTCLITASGAPYAQGFISGSTADSGVLSPVSIAAAVWSALASENNITATMGEKLNDAGSASNPWTEVLEGTYTAADMMRIVTAVLAGKVSGAGTGTETFRDITDTKDRVISLVDSNGNRTTVTLDGA